MSVIRITLIGINGNNWPQLSSCFFFLGGVYVVIPDNSDLNDYQRPGKYYVPSESHAQTIDNLPIALGGTLIVIKLGARYLQIYFCNNSSFYNIYLRRINGNETSDWFVISGTKT